MLTNNEKNVIRSLISSPQWQLVESLAKELKDKIRSEPKKKDTEWETASTCVYDEGQIAGIDRLFNELLKTQE